MLKVAIVEDEKQQSELLNDYLCRYQKERGVKFDVSTFFDGLDFLEKDKSAKFDIVLMDIKMPYVNGMTVAQKMRAYNDTACLIFVTNMVSYAVKGYDVSAMAFMVKPVGYAEFCFKIDKAADICESNKKNEICVKQGKDSFALNTDDILYLESVRHTIIYHTIKAGEITVWNGTMYDEEEKLAPYGFARCNSGLLVNLKHVTKISGAEVFVGGEVLSLSRGRKKAFSESFAKYVAGKM